MLKTVLTAVAVCFALGVTLPAEAKGKKKPHAAKVEKAKVAKPAKK